MGNKQLDELVVNYLSKYVAQMCWEYSSVLLISSSPPGYKNVCGLADCHLLGGDEVRFQLLYARSSGAWEVVCYSSRLREVYLYTSDAKWDFPNVGLKDWSHCWSRCSALETGCIETIEESVNGGAWAGLICQFFRAVVACFLAHSKDGIRFRKQ
jgi:hypothetical protein